MPRLIRVRATRRVTLSIAAALILSAGGIGAAILASSSAAQSPPDPAATPTPAPGATPDSPTPVDAIGYTIAARHPHDRTAFTEGLVFRHGELIESTGQMGQSRITRIDIASGRVLATAKLPPALFGEGIAAHGDTLYSVTWHGGRGFRWSLPKLKQKGTLSYAGEGWGMASDGHSILLSDGTPTIRFLDPASFTVTRTLTVTAGGRPLRNLNELEWIDGQIFANVWQTPWVVRIDPASGAVNGALDTTDLMREAGGDLWDATPNGIAWDEQTRTLYLTGKRWTTLFALKLDPPAAQ